MKKFLAAALTAMLLLTVPGIALAKEEERDVPEGYVEETYKELDFFRPEWLTLSDTINDDYLLYEQLDEDGTILRFPLDIWYHEAELQYIDMWRFDDVGTVDLLARLAKDAIRGDGEEVRELCEIGGRIGLKVTTTVKLDNGEHIAYHYFFLSRYASYNLTVGEVDGMTPEEVEEIADTIVGSIIITPAE